MSIDKITSAILSEAAAESEQILNVAKTKRRALIREIKHRTKVETELAIRQAEEEKEKIISRRKAVADIDSKKIILACKQELMDNCFKEAVGYILSMKEEEFVEFLVSMGKNSGITEGELIFNEKEKSSIGAKVTSALSAAVTDGKFVLSEETRKIQGGYMIKQGQIYIDNSIESVVEENRRDLTAEVAEILFPPEK